MFNFSFMFTAEEARINFKKQLHLTNQHYEPLKTAQDLQLIKKLWTMKYPV